MLMIDALQLLADGRAHRVSALAAALGAPAAAVQAALQQSVEHGVDLQRGPKDWVRLGTPIDWLDPARIEAGIQGLGFDVRVAASCDSTNSELLRAARYGASTKQVVVAELQTHGRGRQGRRWHAGLASALCFSLLWRFEKPVSALGGLSHAVGVAMVRGFRKRGIEAELKWPNDVLWRGHKLAGILIEVQGAAAAACAAVIGVGVNVRLSSAERARIDQSVTDLNEAGGLRACRSDWLAALLRELADGLETYTHCGFAGARAQWDAYHAHRDCAVELRLPDGTYVHGVAKGVDEEGRLLLQTACGEQAVSAADVSLRVAHCS